MTTKPPPAPPDDDPTADNSDPTSNTRHRHRMRFEWRDLIEDLIEDGRQRGVFNDLAGQGRPLSLEPNLYEGSSALANRLLKDNDLRPAWLAARATIMEEIDTLRAEIGRTWERYRIAFANAPDDSHRGSLTIGWDDHCRRWETAIGKLNKQIDDYNLRRRVSQLELFKLRLADELKRVEAPRYLRPLP